MIPQRNLSLLSNRLFRDQGGRRIPEAVLQRDYCLAWFLATLATHPLREHLAFKGGTALRRCASPTTVSRRISTLRSFRPWNFRPSRRALKKSSRRFARRLESNSDSITSTTYMKTVTPSIWHIRARCPRR